MKQKIVVTALPDGINAKGGKWRVSAAIGLQVEDANTTLQNVKDMLGWAELVKNAKFIVELNGNPVEANVVGTKVDPGLWKNLFSPTIKVKSFEQEDFSQLPLVSYPVKHILGYIKTLVEATGKLFSTDLPKSTDYTENPAMTAISDYSVTDFPKRGRTKITLDSIVVNKQTGQRLKGTLNQKKYIPFSNTPNAATDFAQLKNFHGLYDQKPIKNFVQGPRPDFEFHEILSVLSSYPQLLRMLGLVIDLEFTGPVTPMMRGTEPNIRIIPSGINFSATTQFVCPATAYTKTGSGFYARAMEGSVIDKGYLKINTEAFTVFQVDTDGAALKLCQQLDALQLRKAKHIFYAYEGLMPNEAAIPFYSNESPRKEGLPSHRTAGIAVARNGMAENLSGKFKRMNDWKNGLLKGSTAPAGVTGTNASWILTSDVLYADDVNLGYRMDVQPEGSTWFSLHQRKNNYSFINSSGSHIAIPGTDDNDEGFIQTSASEEKTQTGSQLKVGEAIARWEGWSLSVPRPGKSLNDPTTPRKTGEPYQEVYTDKAKEEAKYEGVTDFKLNVKPGIVKGSLPMLRFGKKYSIKIRTVDLAGNSADIHSKPENELAIAGNIRYMRYEPVDAPFLVLGTEVKDGESSEVMVIRSNEGVPVANYEKDNNLGKIYKDESIRHVKPPRTTVEMATTHGMFDKGIGAGNTPAEAAAFAAEAANIYKKITAEKDPLIKEFLPADSPYQLAVIDGNQKTINVEYLVDPMAAGVVFYVSPNDPNLKLADPEILTRRVSFYFDTEVTDTNANEVYNYEKWMKPQTFRVKLREGTPGITWDPASRTLQVNVIKGLIFKMCYACFWRPADLLKHSGILEMMGMSSLGDTIGKRIAKGQHWMFSPPRELSFVHAVQQPITSFGGKTFPQIAKIVPDRDFGENVAKLNSHFLVHGPSTDKLDIEADWIEWIDDVSYSEPQPYKEKDDVQRTLSKSKVFHFTTPYAVFEYVFGDLDAVKGNPFLAIKHQFSDTKHRKVNYKVIASTRYREYFFNLIKEKKDFSLTRESTVIKNVIIPSSARPLAPQVEYVIPNFEWDRVTKGNSTITGRGSGLRVYLKRPWYSSGEGEQLAVVLPMPAANDNLGSSHNATFTTWGSDPTKLSGKPPSIPFGDSPSITVFVGIKKENADLSVSVSEDPTARVMVALFDVKYDKERELYYADIMMNFGFAYFPFVRLALARYQRYSVRKGLQDCCLSPIVQADYIQIPPPRFSSLTYGSSKNNITVGITGTVPNMSMEFLIKIQILIERIDVPSSEQAHISLNARPIEVYNYILTANDISNFTFKHTKIFALPAEYATQPYRVKILEYEMITSDPMKPNPNPGIPGIPNSGFNAGPPMKDRLVFADVYEVNKPASFRER